MRESLVAQRTMGVQFGRLAFLAMLAEMYQKTGQIDEALAVLDEALLEIASTAEHFHEAEIYRLKGELRLIQAGGRQDRSPAAGKVSRIARRDEYKSVMAAAGQEKRGATKVVEDLPMVH